MNLLYRLKEKIILKFKFFESERGKERELQTKLTQIIITSTDPEELKNKIAKEVAIALNAYRCFLRSITYLQIILKKLLTPIILKETQQVYWDMT